MLDSKSRSFLERLLTTPSPSGYEQEVQAHVRAWADDLADEVRTDVQFTITLEDGQIFGQMTGQGPLAIFPSSRDEFFARVVDAQISFVRDGAGEVSQLVLHQNGRDIPWQRVR